MGNLTAAAAVVLVVTVISAAVAYVRVGALTHPRRLRSIGFRKAARRSALRFGGTALLLGYIATGAYGWLRDLQPANALAIMFWAGVAVASVLSVTAAFVRPSLGLGGLPEVVLLSVLWGGSYGWVLPEIVESSGIG